MRRPLPRASLNVGAALRSIHLSGPESDRSNRFPYALASFFVFKISFFLVLVSMDQTASKR